MDLGGQLSLVLLQTSDVSLVSVDSKLGRAKRQKSTSLISLYEQFLYMVWCIAFML